MTEHALLLTDVVDRTLLVERLGDARAAELWAEHDRRARRLLVEHRGREIDRSDGFFLLFDAAADAARYALAYHGALVDLQLGARVGLHVGDVTLRENSADDIARGAKRTEVEGLAKPFAARVMALAGAGQTLLSASARAALGDAALAGAGFGFERHGHYRLKGVDEPAEPFELGVPGQCAFAPPRDTDKAYRVLRDGELWRPLREVRHNLPAERDAFIGRTTELRALAQRLDAGARLLTVLGPGGTGKTRFVCRYASAWRGDWPGGVYFCDLSEARSLDGVFGAVAVALGVRLGKADPGLQLGHAIAGRGRSLVILDNFEQVVAHAPATLGDWLDRAAQASFIVTSRERLHLGGEAVFPVEPLPLDKDAIELFAARARAHRPGFAVDAGNRAAVAEVVRLLDGLPLAIELAAARVNVLSPAQLVERLRDRFKLLAGARGAAAHQATLRAAIDWSWDLLAPWEQAALAQSAVFEGGFTMEAAEAVLDLAAWPHAPPGLDVIQSLVDKSLLLSWVPNEQRRFDLNEPYFGMYLSIFEYAAERLDAGVPGARQRVQVRHGSHYAGFGTEPALDALWRDGGVQRRRRLALELDNLVAACRQAVGRGDGETAVGAYRAACEVLEFQGPFSLAADLGAQVLALDGVSSAARCAALLTHLRATRATGRSKEAGRWIDQARGLATGAQNPRLEGGVLVQFGDLCRDEGRMDEARAHLEAAVALFRIAGDPVAQGRALVILASIHHQQGRIDAGRASHEAALAIHRAMGDRTGECVVLGNLVNLHHEQGRIDEALTHYHQALAIAREVGGRASEGLNLGNLGNLRIDQGDLDEALELQHAALAVHREVGNRRVEGVALGNLGNLPCLKGRLADAQAHYEAALVIAREVGNRRLEDFLLGHLGNLYLDLDQIDRAADFGAQALTIFRAVGDRRGEGFVLGNLADLSVRQGHFNAALDVLRAGETLLRAVGERGELAKLACVRGRAEFALGDLPAARAALAEAESAALALAVGPDSELRHEIDKLQQSLCP